MNNIVKGLLIIFCSFLLLNCAPKMATSENVKKEWMLVEFKDFTKEMMMQNKANLNLGGEVVPGKFSANMGCNGMFGQATFNADGSVEFSEVGMTMMYCDKGMDLESAFSKALPMMTKYSIKGHFLTISDDKGNKMKFVAADWD